MTCVKSWNEEINKTLELAGVTYHEVPQQPNEISVKYNDGVRYVSRHGAYLIVRGVDSNGRATTLFIDKDSWE